VFLECWRTNYATVLPPESISGMTRDRAESIWASALAASETTTLLAVDDGDDVLGVVSFRVEEDGSGYIGSLYVSPTTQGGGVGGKLLGEAADRLAAAGTTRVSLWVFEANGPSRRFYERQGFAIDGRRVTLPEWGQPQVSMSRTLAPKDLRADGVDSRPQ
jgi:ribosomal protein S18 acetylase RimI-like enzyme